MRLNRLLSNIVPLMLVAACAAPCPNCLPLAPEKPSAPPKPVALETITPARPAVIQLAERKEHSYADGLMALARAKIQLDLLARSHARSQLQKTLALIEDFPKRAAHDSQLLMEISYVHDGTKTQLYLPMRDDIQRYDAAKGILSFLGQQKITAQAYRILRFNAAIRPDEARPILLEALAALNPSDAEASKHHLMKCERQIDQFYNLLEMKPYEGPPRKRISMHSMATHGFIAVEAYDLARQALDEAEEALSDFQLNAQEKQLTQNYSAYLKSLEKAIERKDPTLLTQMQGAVKELVGALAP